MSDLWELTRYVEAHPEDYPQRWRLVKKLYMAWEYRQALDHLLVLKREWVRKQNVLRYLAATYYRLGQYDEAIAELAEAVTVWPEELCLQEQLARVHEAAGHIEEAAGLWEQIARQDPQHAVAQRNVSRLRTAPKETGDRELTPRESDSGLNLHPGMLCPSCGAQNGEEFERCWQCHAPLTLLRADTPKPERRPGDGDSRIWVLIGGLMSVALLSWCIYCSLQQWTSGAIAPGSSPPAITVFELLSRNLLITRTALCVILLVVWPMALALGVRLLGTGASSGSATTTAGLWLAALTSAAAWLPGKLAFTGPAVSALVSLALIVVAFRSGALRTLAIWLVQGLLVSGAAALAFVALEGIRPFQELPSIIRYLNETQLADLSTAYKVRDAHLPTELTLEWPSTGSSWLDDKGGPVIFEIRPDAASPPLVADLRDAAQTILYKDIETIPYVFTYAIAPGQPYRLMIHWRDIGLEKAPLPGTITMHSLVHPRVATNS